MSQPTLILHGITLSGHVHRVVLMLRELELAYRFVEAGPEVWRSPDFLALNPLGQIPVLQDGDLTLADSNAILVYLAKRYAPGRHWLPEEPAAAAEVQRWLSVAAGEVRFGPAAARMTRQWNAPGDMERAGAITARLLAFMEAHLKDRLYLAIGQPTIADLACYSYVAHAPEGGIALGSYPAVRAWLTRIEARPRFQAMPRLPLPKAA